MVYRESRFVCKKSHEFKSWAWSNVQSIPCKTKGCRLKAVRALGGATRFAQNSQPFVYYENPKTGKLWIAATNGDVRRPRGYSVKREVRTMRDYDRFRRSQNERSAAESEIDRELERQFNSAFGAIGRENLQRMMSSLSPAGRELARAAIERSYQDQTRAASTEHYISGIENDRSERQPWNDASTGYRRRD